LFYVYATPIKRSGIAYQFVPTMNTFKVSPDFVGKVLTEKTGDFIAFDPVPGLPNTIVTAVEKQMESLQRGPGKPKVTVVSLKAAQKSS
jgi:hypothetical protein